MSLQIQIGADVSGIDQAVDQASKSLNKIKPAALSGVASLNALSQVARDAPFGFIAIQNNLPILFDSFGTLVTKSKGVKNAFGEIAAALDGPVGLSFAIGGVISIITILTQKYGSIGGAIDAFTGKIMSAKEINDKFNESLNDTKKASAGEIANLNSLVRILTDVNSSRNQQIGAFDELNKKYSGLLTDQKIENLNTATSIALIAERTKLIAQQIQLEGRREALIKLIGESALEGEKALNKLTNRNNLTFFEQLAQGIRGTFAGVGGLGVINILSKDLGNAANQTKIYSNTLDVVNNQLTEIEGNFKRVVDTFKKQQKELKDAQREAAKASIGKVTQGEALNNGVITSDIGLLTRVIEANVRLTNLAVDKIRRYREKNSPKPLDLVPKKIETVATTPMSSELQNQVGTTLLELDKLSTKFTQTSQALQSTFLEPLTSAFTEFFETGKLGFKEFAKSIIKTIQQIVAKIIATGIINLLASILSGGSTSVIGGVASATKGINIGKSFGDAFKSVLGISGNKVAAPSFSGVGSGGLQMSGQVVFVQRGSDLVGVLNRTNGTINRVG